jgi:chemotaxis signal transduction protein
MADPAAARAAIIFRVAAVNLALPATSVESIIDYETPRPLPLAPAHVPGVISQGEHLLPILDVARFLALAGRDEVRRRILVVNAAGMRVGIGCERVLALRELPLPVGRAARVLQGEQLQRFLEHELDTKEGLVGVLDLAALLEAARVKA